MTTDAAMCVAGNTTGASENQGICRKSNALITEVIGPAISGSIMNMSFALKIMRLILIPL